MRSLKAICGLAVVALVLSGCGGGGSSSGSASSGSGLATGSSPTTATGSSPTTGSATLNWEAPSTNTNGSALTDLAGYHIYYGASSGSMSNEVDVPNAGKTTYVISNLAAGTWYFGIKAYTNTGLESSMSNVGSKTIT